MEIKRVLRITAGAIVLAAIATSSFVVTLYFSQGLGPDLRYELGWEYIDDSNYNETFYAGNIVMFEGSMFCIEMGHLTINTTYRWYIEYPRMYQFIANETTHFFWMILYKGEILEFQRRVPDTNAAGQHQWEYLTLIEFGLVKKR